MSIAASIIAGFAFAILWAVLIALGRAIKEILSTEGPVDEWYYSHEHDAYLFKARKDRKPWFKK